VRPILEYGAACWDPYRKGADLVQNIEAKFAHHRNDAKWQTLTQLRKRTSFCALFKAYKGERAWKAIGDRLQRPRYLIKIEQNKKIWSRKQKRAIGKYSFVNRTVQLWNQLPADALGEAKRRCGENHQKSTDVK
jgi:hypothetical protein